MTNVDKVKNEVKSAEKRTGKGGKEEKEEAKSERKIVDSGRVRLDEKEKEIQF